MNKPATTPLEILLDGDVPVLTATQLLRMKQESLKPGALVAGAYYKGYLGPNSAIGRWNGQQLRFVVRLQERGASKLKGASHVLESDAGNVFAPYEQVQVEKDQQISDFDLNTVR